MRSMHRTPLNLIVHYVGKCHTLRKRWDYVPRGNLLHFFIKAGFRTSKPASHQPIDAAHDRPSVVPSACGPQAHADLPHQQPPRPGRVAAIGPYFGTTEAFASTP